MKRSQKKYFKLIIKISVTTLALYFVFQKIDIIELKETLSTVNIFFFLLALLSFNVSKIISAFRLNEFYKSLKIFLATKDQLRLYYLGMFYNLFLPGAIGGDGYKIYLLRQHNEVKTKNLVSASILDRVSGLVHLFIMGAIFLLLSSVNNELGIYSWLIILSIILAIPIFYIIKKLFFKIYLDIFFKINIQSFCFF